MRTVAGADKIVVLSNCIVAEQGKPDELYMRKMEYIHIWLIYNQIAENGR